MKPLFLKHPALFILLIFMGSNAFTQPARYSVANAHAHNDYEHNIPFVQAFDLGFGSVEADVILEKDTLFVGHNHEDIYNKPLYFERDYIEPLNAAIRINKDAGRQVVLLIDLKTEAMATLNKVMEIIEKYPALTRSPAVRFVITGNQPAPSDFENYPAYIYFDGDINNPGHLQHLSRIGMFSDNFRKYSQWKGKGSIPKSEEEALITLINKVHAVHKKIRFWGCPDNPHAWKVFMKLKIDYLNTDHIDQLAAFLK